MKLRMPGLYVSMHIIQTFDMPWPQTVLFHNGCCSDRAGFSRYFIQSVQFSPFADWVVRGDMRNNSAENLFQSFLLEAL